MGEKLPVFSLKIGLIIKTYFKIKKAIAKSL